MCAGVGRGASHVKKRVCDGTGVHGVPHRERVRVAATMATADGAAAAAAAMKEAPQTPNGAASGAGAAASAAAAAGDAPPRDAAAAAVPSSPARPSAEEATRAATEVAESIWSRIQVRTTLLVSLTDSGIIEQCRLILRLPAS